MLALLKYGLHSADWAAGCQRAVSLLPAIMWY